MPRKSEGTKVAEEQEEHFEIMPSEWTPEEPAARGVKPMSTSPAHSTETARRIHRPTGPRI